MRVLIVENETYAAKNLSAALNEIRPEFQLLKVCETVDEAKASIEKDKPDLVFLDVILDGNTTGIDLIAEMKAINFKVIFTTSFEQYAIAAFRLNAIDYLLKPYSNDDLLNAINKVETMCRGEQKQSLNGLKNYSDLRFKNSTFLTFKGNKGEYIIRRFDEIVYLEADGSYIIIHFKDSKSLTTSQGSLNDYELVLPREYFLRIHQKTIVNLMFVDRYFRGKTFKNKTSNIGSAGYLQLSSGLTLPVSRGYYNSVKESLGF
ncbi:MAG: response regulator transcription factor [Candidatus Delongbacteria bacterium]|nr:response regulator transcription factor [Candidatus Delongbacteria bacterium]